MKHDKNFATYAALSFLATLALALFQAKNPGNWLNGFLGIAPLLLTTSVAAYCGYKTQLSLQDESKLAGIMGLTVCLFSLLAAFMPEKLGPLAIMAMLGSLCYAGFYFAWPKTSDEVQV